MCAGAVELLTWPHRCCSVQGEEVRMIERGGSISRGSSYR